MKISEKELREKAKHLLQPVVPRSITIGDVSISVIFGTRVDVSLGNYEVVIHKGDEHVAHGRFNTVVKQALHAIRQSK